ncbi:L-xylulose 5-phosphate 3-epimerase [Thermoanaerobacter uzonensis DSM 18761]|jgi:predicted hexulose-6-phosphate isomerase|uniref:L-ribulose-5-phosphate 3-epimerase n=1 Tax=Thermoanaerobacter uzonensis DSM 18761 TaxID=1123369 RepID=A0A1M4SMN0_9THEO|nr:L-ribulose-5-phosphate 3-epimerase [Thermoanaerobacter uzonensis]SHE33446.1 L-xylulose 5-phosphate 3-epimerase [Thermoanaerobacter uzonensis DSM 18761]
MFDLTKIPIGIYEKAISNDLSFYEKLVIAKRAGFDFVEISIDENDERIKRLYMNEKELKEFKNIIEEAGIPILSMCLSVHRRYSLGSTDYNIRNKALDIMKRAIIFSNLLGIRTIQIAGYDVYYEKSTEYTKNMFKQNLLQAIEWASKAQVMLAIETMDYELVNSVNKALEYVNYYNSPWFKIYPDIGNLTAWGFNVENEIEAGMGNIVAIHLKDTLPGQYRRVPFGNGVVDFVRCFKKLNEIGFNGPYLIEMWSSDKDLEISYNTIYNARLWIVDKMRKAGFKLE